MQIIVSQVMRYYGYIVRRFSIDIAFVMRPPQEVVGIVPVIKYNLVIVSEFCFTYTTSVRFFTHATWCASERVILSFFEVYLFRQQFERGDQFLHNIFSSLQKDSRRIQRAEGFSTFVTFSWWRWGCEYLMDILFMSSQVPW